jgi:hypothetical protein
MIINIENKIKILPFIRETNWKELITTWNDDELNIKLSKFYLLTTQNETIVLNQDFDIPVLIDDKFQIINIEKLLNINLMSNDVQLFKFLNNSKKSNQNILELITNKIIINLFNDFDFITNKLVSIKPFASENGVLIANMIKKIILIDNHLFFINQKSEKLHSNLSISNTKIDANLIENINDKLFILDEGINIIDSISNLNQLSNLKSDLLVLLNGLKSSIDSLDT